MDCSNAGVDDHRTFEGSPLFAPTVAMLNGPNQLTVGRPRQRSAEKRAAAGLISEEVGWRQTPTLPIETAPRILVTRWASSEIQTREVSAETSADGYVVGLVLRPMDIRLSVAGRVVHDGVALPGMMHVSEPSTSAQCLFRGPYDALHLHVPKGLLIECGGQHQTAHAETLRSESAPRRDPIALQLGLSLLKAEEFATSLGSIYADGISLAIVSRLLALQAKGRPACGRTKVVALSSWRLRRVLEFIDAHLDETLSLTDVAAASGLSRMHFAAQFKAATGCRPHDYLLQQRINRAQQIMLSSAVPLVEVALRVGFQSQAHFTTVFKQLVGQPPHAWRQSRNASRPAGPALNASARQSAA